MSTTEVRHFTTEQLEGFAREEAKLGEEIHVDDVRRVVVAMFRHGALHPDSTIDGVRIAEMEGSS